MKIFRSSGGAAGKESGEEVTSRLSAGTYIELVRSLFTTLAPTSIMTISFVAVGLFLIGRTPDPMLILFFALGVIASAVRIAVLLVLRGKAASETLDVVTAGRLERQFRRPYLVFAATFGAFAARGFAIVPGEDRILLTALLFGYGAGVAAGISLRPWISIPAVLVAIVPAVITSLFMPGVNSWGTGILTATFLAGGIQSMLRRYQATSRQISMHRLLSTLGRLDDLTRLPNRLLLAEKFDQLAAAHSGAEVVAVHCVDIEGLGQVNESYGYPAGDALLKTITDRINRTLADGDFAARLSGIEFAIVQPHLVQGRQAEILAQQLMIALSKPFSIDGRDIRITVKIGYAYDVQQDADLEFLLDGAGQAVQKAVAESISIVCHTQPKWPTSTEEPSTL